MLPWLRLDPDPVEDSAVECWGTAMNRRRLGVMTGCVVALVAAGLASVEVASTAATPSWLAPETLSTPGGAAFRPQIAVDGRGTVVAVWLQQDDAGYTRVVTARRPAGGAWRSPVTLSGAGRDADEARVAVNERGDAVAVWWTRADGSNDRVESAFRPRSGVWSSPDILSDPLRHSYRPEVAIDPEGNAVAVWVRYDADDANTEWVQSARRPAHGSWSPLATLSEHHALDAHVALDDDGNALAVWTRYNGTNHTVQSADRPAGGSWSTPVTLSVPGQNALWSQVALDGQGNAVAVWIRDDGDDLVQTADRPVGGSWSTPVTLSEAGRSAYRPQVAVGAQGDAVVVWRRLLSGISDVDRVVAVDRPAGGAWSSPVALSSQSLPAFDPEAAVDRNGNAIVVWEQLDNAPRRVDTAELSAGGAWTHRGFLSESGPSANEPQVTFDAQGNAVSAWWSQPTGSAATVRAVGSDRAGPVSTVAAPTPRRQTTTTFLASWSGTDTWSHVADYDVRYRSASFNERFGPKVRWQTATTSTSAEFTGEPGYTYCLAARARDAFSFVGPWSAERCAAAPVDDRSLTARGGWTRETGTGHYLGTSTSSRRHGAVLELAGVQARRLGLVATRMPGGGSVSVSLNGRTLRTASLDSDTVDEKQLVYVRRFPTVRTGDLTIRVVSPTGRPVSIDGIIASRR
jgi:hypothetical protein